MSTVKSLVKYTSTELKYFPSRLAVVFAQSIIARCLIENEDVAGAAPTGEASTTSKWSTILLPTQVRLIIEVWHCLFWMEETCYHEHVIVHWQQDISKCQLWANCFMIWNALWTHNFWISQRHFRHSQRWPACQKIILKLKSREIPFALIPHFSFVGETSGPADKERVIRRAFSCYDVIITSPSRPARACQLQ